MCLRNEKISVSAVPRKLKEIGNYSTQRWKALLLVWPIGQALQFANRQIRDFTHVDSRQIRRPVRCERLILRSLASCLELNPDSKVQSSPVCSGDCPVLPISCIHRCAFHAAPVKTNNKSFWTLVKRSHLFCFMSAFLAKLRVCVCVQDYLENKSQLVSWWVSINLSHEAITQILPFPPRGNSRPTRNRIESFFWLNSRTLRQPDQWLENLISI